MKKMKPGNKIHELYETATKKIKDKMPDLIENFMPTMGFGMPAPTAYPFHSLLHSF